MTIFEELRDGLRPKLLEWVERTFPEPVEIESNPAVPVSPAVYLYVRRDDGTRHLPIIRLAHQRWGIWYVGQGKSMSARYNGHYDKPGTCRPFDLLRLLDGLDRVNEIQLDSDQVKTSGGDADRSASPAIELGSPRVVERPARGGHDRPLCRIAVDGLDSDVWPREPI